MRILKSNAHRKPISRTHSICSDTLRAQTWYWGRISALFLVLAFFSSSVALASKETSCRCPIFEFGRSVPLQHPLSFYGEAYWRPQRLNSPTEAASGHISKSRRHELWFCILYWFLRWNIKSQESRRQVVHSFLFKHWPTHLSLHQTAFALPLPMLIVSWDRDRYTSYTQNKTKSCLMKKSP